MDRTRITKATTALGELYGAHQKHGGVWPDTRDEVRAVARALGVEDYGRVADDELAVQAIWEVGQEAVELETLAAVHVAALDGRPVTYDTESSLWRTLDGRELPLDEVEELGLDGTLLP